jgi:3',5'-cyclic-AMP phosphodiesterase
VRALAWGHVHQEYDGKRGNVRLFGTPSTGAQFLPNSDRYAVDTRPPAYRLFTLHSDGRIESEIRWVRSLPLRQAATAR